MVEEARWITLDTRRYRRKGFKNLRRHYGLCSYCEPFGSVKVKLMNLHFIKYHPEEIKKMQKMFSKGEMGIINGVRFIIT